MPFVVTLDRPDPSAEFYSLEVHRFNPSTSDFRIFYSMLDLSEEDFPHSVEHGVESGHFYDYSIVRHGPGGRATVDVGYRTIGFTGEPQPLLVYHVLS